jgi:hypothetical protein
MSYSDWSGHLIAARKRLASAEAALALQHWTLAAIELGTAQYELDRMWDWIEAKREPMQETVDNLGGQA